MTIHEAAEIIRNPKDHWSHEKDDAEKVALQLLLAMDDILEEINKEVEYD